MTKEPITIPVAKGVEDLIPMFLKNRTDEIELLRKALSEGAFHEISRVAHRMRGVGQPYGFDLVSALGVKIEEAATASDRIALSECIAEYADYLARVRVVYK